MIMLIINKTVETRKTINTEIHMQIRKRRRTDDQKLEVIRDYNNGMLLKDIELKYKMSRSTVYKYISELESKLLSFDEFLEKKNEDETSNTSEI